MVALLAAPHTTVHRPRHPTVQPSYAQDRTTRAAVVAVGDETAIGAPSVIVSIGRMKRAASAAIQPVYGSCAHSAQPSRTEYRSVAPSR